MKLLTTPFSRYSGVLAGLIFVLIMIANLSFAPKSVFLGYSSLHKGHKCLHVPTNRVYISRDVVFDENVFPFSVMPQSSTTTPSMHSSPLMPGQFEDVAYSPVLLPNHGAGTGVDCWKYALEAIIKGLLLYFLVHDNCLLFML